MNPADPNHGNPTMQTLSIDALATYHGDLRPASASWTVRATIPGGDPIDRAGAADGGANEINATAVLEALRFARDVGHDGPVHVHVPFMLGWGIAPALRGEDPPGETDRAWELREIARLARSFGALLRVDSDLPLARQPALQEAGERMLVGEGARRRDRRPASTA